MTPPRLATRFRDLGTPARGLLLSLLALAMVVTSPAPFHVHLSSNPGLYDAECPLAELAGGHGEASLPSAPPAVWAGRVEGFVLFTAPGLARALAVVVTESRAPPFA